MSILTNDVGILEAERDRYKAENESLKARMAEQAGALRESRAQNRELILRNEKLAAQIARLYKHLRDSLGSAEHIVKAQAALEPELPGVPAGAMPTIADRPPSRIKLRDRLNGLVAGAAA